MCNVNNISVPLFRYLITVKFVIQNIKKTFIQNFHVHKRLENPFYSSLILSPFKIHHLKSTINETKIIKDKLNLNKFVSVLLSTMVNNTR